MRTMVFAGRNRKELLRDPVSYIFCLGLPVFMLLVMTVVNENIPKQANMTIFNVDQLAPGIGLFSLSFVMLFTCLQVSKDRSSSFLLRLYASPMKAWDYIAGYALPLMGIALGQCVVTYAVSMVIGAFTGVTFVWGRVVLSILTLMPSAVLFIGFGLLFGSLFNDKASPPFSSIIITLSTILGGVWMDVSQLGGLMKTLCEVLPFYHGVEAARAAVAGNYGDIRVSLLIVCGYAVVVFGLAAAAFKQKMKSDAA